MMTQTLALFAAVLLLAASPAHEHTDTSRQKDVAARGAQVMPFSLDKTLHRFEALKDGGRQRVTAKDARDKEQIRLVRAHLQEEALRFARGDFSDPARIHGEDMPGLAELSAGASRLQVSYAPLPDGAEIVYTSKDPALIDAIHRWFRAQTHDHGRHAH